MRALLVGKVEGGSTMTHDRKVSHNCFRERILNSLAQIMSKPTGIFEIVACKH